MISFIIPTKNEEIIIRDTLEYLKRYSGAHEIIVSDGRSTDSTIEIAKSLSAKVVVYAGEKRQTIGGGRNLGAEIALGEYLVFIDADVIIPDINRFFEKAIKHFEKNQKLVALTVQYKVLPKYESLADKIIFKILSANFALFNNFLHIGVSGGEFQMIKRTVFEELGGFDDTLVAAEDCDMFARLARIGRTYCDMSLVVYHTGRREHKIGWPKLIYQWMRNYLTVVILKRSWSEEWTEIR